MIPHQLIDILDRLPSALQTEVLHYAQYLAAQQSKSSIPEQTPTKYRQAGILKGMFTMADDFDAPLEDLKDYM
jgi:secreted trypsin-like serine protease